MNCTNTSANWVIFSFITWMSFAWVSVRPWTSLYISFYLCNNTFASLFFSQSINFSLFDIWLSFFPCLLLLSHLSISISLLLSLCKSVSLSLSLFLLVILLYFSLCFSLTLFVSLRLSFSLSPSVSFSLSLTQTHPVCNHLVFAQRRDRNMIYRFICLSITLSVCPMVL